MGMTLLITVLSATGTLEILEGADWYMLFDVAIIGACAIGLWFKSRTAAVAMFIYFLLSKFIQFSTGQFNGIFMALIFLFFYGRAVIGSFRYHTLFKKGANQADIF